MDLRRTVIAVWLLTSMLTSSVAVMGACVGEQCRVNATQLNAGCCCARVVEPPRCCGSTHSDHEGQNNSKSGSCDCIHAPWGDFEVFYQGVTVAKSSTEFTRSLSYVWVFWQEVSQAGSCLFKPISQGPPEITQPLITFCKRQV